MLIEFLVRHGLRANTLTYLGLFASLVAGCLLTVGEWTLAACCIVVSGALDLMDGAVARRAGTSGKFGALLDSSLDRYSDSFYYSGLIMYFSMQQQVIYTILTLSAFMAAFSVSYIRARGEGLGYPTFVGFWERGERVVFLLIMLFTGTVKAGVIVLAILPHLTALNRLIDINIQISSKTPQTCSSLAHRKNKYSQAGFWAQSAGLVTLLFLIDFLIY